MKRRLLVVYDYDHEENGFVLLDATQPLAKSRSYAEVLEVKKALELEQGK